VVNTFIYEKNTQIECVPYVLISKMNNWYYKSHCRIYYPPEEYSQ